MDKREEKWDILKGLAIWLVVWGHLTTDQNLEIIIYVIHMPLFFMASGYFAYYSYQSDDFGIILKKKAARILVPFITWSGVAVAANCVREFLINGFHADFLIHKLVEVYVTSMSVWFLWALFVIFLLFSLAFWLGKYIGYISYIIIWVGMVCILPINLFSFNKIAMNFIWFLLGYFLHNLNLKNRIFTFFRKGSILYIPLYFIVFRLISVEEFWKWYSFTMEDMDAGRITFISVVLTLYTLIGMTFIWEWVIPFIEIVKLKQGVLGIGGQTLEIYTMHMMFVSYFTVIPKFIDQNGIVFNYFYLPLYVTLICYIIIILSNKILHKIKLYNIFMLGRIKNPN